MELHERLASTSSASVSAGGHRQEAPDPFADLKNRLHLAIISELGPQLFTAGGDQAFVRDRVMTEIKTRLGQEVGLSRLDRDRLEGELS